ncbi:MAG: ATP-binding protein [Bryobacterales bacterium]|nr:ATP-binding protein [Bryobacteraceae bacterium]MDW8354959.1 ATP-binding protein [Bryobacterales bacterium]
MPWPVPASFRAQISIITAASGATLALAFLLVQDVIRGTQDTLVEEARLQTGAACRELSEQFRDRLAYGGEALAELPFEAQDLSLRGLASAVLRSYEGMQGGFHVPPGKIAGYAFPTAARPRQLADPEKALVEAAVRRARDRKIPAAETASWNGDLAVVTAAPVENGQAVAWALKRFSWVREATPGRRAWWIGALALSATLGIAGTLSVWLFLRSGVQTIRAGLRRLELDFAHRLPAIPGELGEIAQAVNQMAERRAALEAEVRRQDRLAVLGRLVAAVAHEIRNPLNSLRLTLELLRRRMDKGAARPEEMDAAVAQVDRLDAILTRLLTFGRAAPAERRRQPVKPVVEEAVRLAAEPARTRGVEVRLETAPADLTAELDAAQIQQVLLNLLLNAVEASPPGQTVEVRCQAHDGAVVILVTDHGPGIPESAQPYVFDAFFTTKPDGTGLGLAVSREIVSHHGGSLDFVTGPEGTTFRLRLPQQEHAA